MITRFHIPEASAERCRLVLRMTKARLHSGRDRPPLAPWRLWADVKHRKSTDGRLPLVLSIGGSRRSIHIPPVLLPPVYFTGLLIGLWIWKCVMMVIFQNKIIYMPGLPPNARWEKITDWEKHCGGLKWEEDRTVAEDGTDLAVVYATVPLPKSKSRALMATKEGPSAHVYILYFQGNASSIPPRLPDISWVLHAVTNNPKEKILGAKELTFVCLSYRGYWTSRGRPSEPGLRLDAQAGARWIAERHERIYGKHSGTVPILLVWGQSIGSGVATNLAATGKLPANMPIRGLLLETPFVSIKAMLEAIYPQKWLPYKHLWPFLRNHLDSWANFGIIANACRKEGRPAPLVYILQAERDEIVPKEQSEQLYQRCLELGIPVERGIVPSAYHQQAITYGDGKALAAEAILKLIKAGLYNG